MEISKIGFERQKKIREKNEMAKTALNESELRNSQSIKTQKKPLEATDKAKDGAAATAAGGSALNTSLVVQNIAQVSRFDSVHPIRTF